MLEGFNSASLEDDGTTFEEEEAEAPADAGLDEDEELPDGEGVLSCEEDEAVSEEGSPERALSEASLPDEKIGPDPALSKPSEGLSGQKTASSESSKRVSAKAPKMI